jgi:hypothetical protein
MKPSTAGQAEWKHVTPPATYEGDYLTGLDFPIGALGGSVIRMNGKAEREWWQIFNNFEERKGSGKLPNSFFCRPHGTGGMRLAYAPCRPRRSDRSHRCSASVSRGNIRSDGLPSRMTPCRSGSCSRPTTR